MDRPLVKCLICGKEMKTLVSHLTTVHNTTVADYKLDYHTEEVGYTVTPAIKGQKFAKTVFRGPVETLIDTLNDDEKNYFGKRYNQLFASAQEDKDLEATVRDIVYNELMIMRYQSKLGRTVQSKLNPVEVKALHGVCAQLTAANSQALKELNLTLEKKHQMNKSPETTPDRMVTAYAMAVSIMTPRERARQLKDEEAAMARLKANADDLKKLVPTGGYAEVDGDGFEIDE